MKVMTLTGLGSEQNFETGGTGYFLVFNKGELRVPITEEAAEVVVKEMYGSQSHVPETDSEVVHQSAPSSDDEEDDGIDQI